MSIADIGWKSSRGLHRAVNQGTALGDVGTVADLFATVLRPIAEQRGVETWEQLAADAAEEWVPSRIASLTASRQESPDELRGRDRLRLVTRAAEDIEMPVFSDDVIRRRRDGAIGEFVVVWIGDDEPEAKRGTYPQEVAFQGVDFIHTVKDGLRACRSGHRSDDLRVFEQDFRGHCPEKCPIEPSVEQWSMRMPEAEHPRHHVGIDDYRHR